ncbi:McrB family protein [Thiomicrorhabdus sp. Milos-T2]|uniref:McrB family protein n=1 Tax=Thiomicrorhabdus sp. Milos-T2 TaxID=90814 RepID=UPI00049434E6|nr:AAA family ATPase [Thiomicrorhabdus sp. Milos-T2]
MNQDLRKERLENLYKLLIIDRKPNLTSWHDSYKKIVERVKIRGDAIKNNKSLDSSEDSDFLHDLIFNRNNGVSSLRATPFSEKNYQAAINNKDFLNLISNIIQAPDKSENYSKLCDGWKKLLKTDDGKEGNQNSSVINRVFAGCSTNVSSTVNPTYFNEVYAWFIKENLIDKDENEGNWFSKNINLMNQLKVIFKTELSDEQNLDFDEYWLSIFVWYLYEEIVNPFSLKKQVIKYGAPGTGKTYSVKKQTKLFFTVWKDEFALDSNFYFENQMSLVQFHPSFSYEDFIEGLRPDTEGNLSLHNGIFKEFCQKAAKWEVDYYNLQEPKCVDGKPVVFENLTIADLEGLGLDKQHWEYIISNPLKNKKVVDAIPPFFFVIDEINRAELSRVFGELMYCLEYRGIDGKVKTQYSNLNDSKTGMIKVGEEYQFFIPHNVYVIGTMNTIDRSVESFDFALRRRFRWEAVKPDTSVLRDSLPKAWKSLADNLKELNENITMQPLLGEDYCIGHAYLMNLSYSKEHTLNQVRELIWEDSILPLIEEYLRGSGQNELIAKFKKAFGL